MCLRCGDMKHFDNRVFAKALVKMKAVKESRAKYRIQAQLEDEFKGDYRKLLISLNTNIKTILLKSSKT